MYIYIYIYIYIYMYGRGEDHAAQDDEVVGLARGSGAEGRAQAYVILYYITLHYIILYYVILYYTILYYIILYDTILYYITTRVPAEWKRGEQL